MRRKRDGKSIGAWGLLCAGALFGVGCAGEVMDDGSAPAESEATPERKVVFSSSYSATGRFDVTEAADGRLGMDLLGDSEADDPTVVTAKIRNDSLVATYRGLHPGAAVPALLEELERRFVAQPRAAGRDVPVAAPAAAPPLGATTAGVQQIGSSIRRALFTAQFCQPRQGPGFYEVNTECRYTTAAENLCRSIGDRDNVYGKNDTNNLVFVEVKSDHGIWLNPGQWGVVNTWRPRATGCVRPFRAGGIGMAIGHMTELPQ